MTAPAGDAAAAEVLRQAADAWYFRVVLNPDARRTMGSTAVVMAVPKLLRAAAKKIAEGRLPAGTPAPAGQAPGPEPLSLSPILTAITRFAHDPAGTAGKVQHVTGIGEVRWAPAGPVEVEGYRSLRVRMHRRDDATRVTGRLRDAGWEVQHMPHHTDLTIITGDGR